VLQEWTEEEVADGTLEPRIRKAIAIAGGDVVMPKMDSQCLGHNVFSMAPEEA